MSDDDSTNYPEEKRSEPRNMLDQPYSVEIDIGRPIPAFQLKLRDISGHGSCILVQEDSSILNHLTVGQELKMKYWTDSRAEPMGYFRVQVIHISKPVEEQFKKHYLIGLIIQKRYDFVSDKTEFGSIKADRDINGDVNRRQATERRIASNSGYVEEKRSGKDRRRGLDRRSGADRRIGVDRRAERNY